MMQCPRCKTIDACISKYQSVIFCGQCGTELVPTRSNLPKCRCENYLFPHQKFCTGCGLSREEVQESKPVGTSEWRLVDLDKEIEKELSKIEENAKTRLVGMLELRYKIRLLGR